MKEPIVVNSNNSFLPSLLLVLFIGLKLTGYITWSWVWVLSPLWIPLAAVLVFIVVVFVIAMLAEIFK